jgi:hypothetical protein
MVFQLKHTHMVGILTKTNTLTIPMPNPIHVPFLLLSSLASELAATIITLLPANC